MPQFFPTTMHVFVKFSLVANLPVLLLFIYGKLGTSKIDCGDKI